MIRDQRPAHDAWCRALLILAWLCLTLPGFAHAAPLGAKHMIRGQAEAHFFLPGTTRATRVYSNTVEAEVASVEALAFDAPRVEARVAAGVQVAIPFTLVNHGNVATDFRVSVDSAQTDGLALIDPQIYLDNNLNSVVDEGERRLGADDVAALGYGQRVALIVRGTVPAGATPGAPVRLGLVATSVLQKRTARAEASLKVSSGAALRFTLDATPRRIVPGQAAGFSATVKNSGQAAIAAGTALGQPITIDGAASRTLLLRHVLPAGLDYVADSLSVSGAAPGYQTLYRLHGDAPFAYRSRADGGGRIVEIAVGAPRGLPAGMSLSVRFMLRAAAAQQATTWRVDADLYYADASKPDVSRHEQAGAVQLQLAIAGQPDLVPRVLGAERFVIGHAAGYSIAAANLGSARSAGEYTLSVTLPAGVRPLRAAGTDWTCAVEGQLAACTASRPLLAGTQSAEVRIEVDTAAGITPDTEAAGRFEARIEVAGGGEPDHLRGNNVLFDPLNLMFGASVSGHAWFDPTHDGARADAATPLAGWHVQLWRVAASAATAAAGTPELIKEARTDATGAYTIAGIAPGPGYQLRFLSDRERVVGTPVVDPKSTGMASTRITRDFAHGALIYTEPFEAGRHYDGQNLEVSPSGVVYDAFTRQPVRNAQVDLVAPADFDASRHLAGGAANLSSVTDENGYYTFELTPDAPAGEYSLRVQASGYTAPAAAEPLRVDGTAPAAFLKDAALRRPVRRVLADASIPPVDPVNGDPAFHAQIQRPLGAPRLVNNPLGLQPQAGALGGLILEKNADRKSVELIDFLHYTLKLRHTYSAALPGFEIHDALPRGFSYVAGSARVAFGDAHWQPLPDPRQSADGTRHLLFDLNNKSLPPGRTYSIMYRVAVGANAAEGARASSTAHARAGAARSNDAVAVVRVLGGVFSDDAFVAGKVYLACSGADTQRAGDQGVPGVRIYLEDGSYADTDIDGKYSLYGLQPLTHVLKLDATTLPAGAQPLATSSRHAGHGASRFLDVRNGEFGRGDFALTCGAGTLAEVAERRAALDGAPDEIDSALKLRLDAQHTERSNTDVKGRAAAGTVGTGNASTTDWESEPDTAKRSGNARTPGMPNGSGPSGAPNTPNSPAVSSASTASAAASASSGKNSATPAATTPPAPSHDALLRSAEPVPAIAFPSDGAVLAARYTNITVSGQLGAGFALTVNGRPVAGASVGRRSELAERGVAAWDYIGVDLRAGINEITVSQTAAGRSATQTIHVTAPGELARIELLLPERMQADGKTPVEIGVRLLDQHDVPVSARTPLTLEIGAGVWRTQDLNETEPGVQVFLQGGTGWFTLVPPATAGATRLRVSSGVIGTEQQVSFVPALRPMLMAGIVEGTLSLRNGAIQPLGGARNNGFERELTRLSRDWNGGKAGAGARAAFFLKGQVKGDYLLTAAFDSEKEGGARLFRDIEPDRYYPVYGDSSVRGYDAQSSGRLYVRVDKDRSYLLIGDFSTASPGDVRQLTQYNRAVTGVQQHYENDTVNATVFASHDSLRQQVIEFPANGMTTFFGVLQDYLPGSERVEIVTRERSQAALNPVVETLVRHRDYTIDELSGTITLADEHANAIDPGTLAPRVIPISYETEGDGSKYWLLGADAQVTVLEGLKLGAVAIEDRNPAQRRHLRGVTVQAALGANTTLAGEYALTYAGENLLGASAAGNGRGLGGHGHGWRLEARHEAGRLKAQIATVHTDLAFDNLSAPVQGGRGESRAQSEYRLDERTRLKAEVVRTADRGHAGWSSPAQDAQRGGALSSGLDAERALAERRDDSVDYIGALFGIERRLTEHLTGEVGMRVVRGNARTGDDREDLDLLTARGRLSSVVPFMPKAVVYGEYEQDVRDPSKRMLALGGDYALGAGSRIYARHELMSSLGSLYEMNGSQRTYRTLAGIESAYMKGGTVFSEYRMAEPVSGSEAQRAYGLRNTWQVNDKLRLRGAFERTETLSDKKRDNAARRTQANVLRSTVEYRASARLKGYNSLELRRATNESNLLHTVGAAYRLNTDWTLLGKHTLYRARGRNGSDTNVFRLRQRVGIAYRPRDSNLLNGLAMVEHRYESGAGSEHHTAHGRTNIASALVNVQPNRRLTVSGRYAFKHRGISGYGLDSATHAHLLAGRVTHDVGHKSDVGLSGSTFIDSLGQRKHAFGIEAGHRIKDDLWMSVGYNLIGFQDRDFRDLAQTQKGFYLRMRFKFDENTW